MPSRPHSNRRSNRRTRRTGLIDTAPLRATLAEARRAAVRVLTCYPIGGPEYRAAEEVLRTLEALSRLLEE
jgi:hypothetical protein